MPIYSENKLSNGTFEDASGWTLNGTFTIAGGMLNWNAGSKLSVVQSIDPQTAGTFLAVGTISSYVPNDPEVDDHFRIVVDDIQSSEVTVADGVFTATVTLSADQGGEASTFTILNEDVAPGTTLKMDSLALRKLMETPTGAFGIAADTLRTMIAASAAFQTAVGAADAYDAAGHVHIGAYKPEDKTIVRPVVLITRDGGDRKGRAGNNAYLQSGSLRVLFEREKSAALQDADYASAAEVEFTDVWDAIVDQVLTLGEEAGYLIIRDWETVEGPFEYDAAELANVLGQWDRVTWGVE